MATHGVRRTGKLALVLMSAALPATLLAPPTTAVTALSMRGADVSTAQRALDLGAKYHDANGTAKTRSTSSKPPA